MPLRVIHCGTGATGKRALQGILNHPDLELAGHYVWSPDKRGQDSGTICGLEPCGITATNDWDELLALQADCLAYFGDAMGREEESIHHAIPFLERGTNVVSLSAFVLAHAASAPSELRDPVEAACRRGNSTLFFSGIDPGWATTDLAIAALAAADGVDCVRVLELGNFSSYPSQALRSYFGFGMEPGFIPLVLKDGYLQQMWGPGLHHIADVLGAKIDGWETHFEVDCLDHDIEAGIGLVKAGTASAIHFELRAMSGGKPIAIAEHVDAIADGAGLQWKRSNAGTRLAHRVEIEGETNFSIEVAYAPDGSARIATVMPVVNAIPAVCAAQPGIVGPLDIPRYWTRNVRKDVTPGDLNHSGRSR
jgi:hypothetical protein